MSELFAEKDRDFDGKLSFEEFAGQQTKLERAFKAMDKDGDGYITKVRPGSYPPGLSLVDSEEEGRDTRNHVGKKNK